jgi:hypothetical protein
MSVCRSGSEMETKRASIRGGVGTEGTTVGCTHLAALFLSGMNLRFGT